MGVKMEFIKVSEWGQVPYGTRVFMTLQEKDIPNMMIEGRNLPKTTVVWSDVSKLEKESKYETVTYEELVAKFKPLSYVR